MSNLNENLNKVKDTIESTEKKIQEDKNIDKAKEKILDSQYVKKVKKMTNTKTGKELKNKYLKFVIIGAFAIVILLVFNPFGGESKKAINYVESHMKEQKRSGDSVKSLKFTGKVIAKNTANHVYAVDVKAIIEWDEDEPKPIETTCFYIVGKGEEGFYINNIVEYGEGSRDRKSALLLVESAVSKG